MSGRDPCIIGVASHTVRGLAAPEPLDLAAQVLADAARDSGADGTLAAIDSLATTYCQTWQYDDLPLRLADQLGIAPRHRFAAGIGGTTPQQLVDDAAERILRGEIDVAAVVSAEALATRAAAKKRGERPTYRFPPEAKRPFPWEAPFHPAEVAHDVFQAWLTFALFDNARRAHLGIALDEYRRRLGAMFSAMTAVAAENPDAWFPTFRTPDDISEPRPDNRMVGYPYTKYMVAVMDVDMAAALIVASDAAADRLGVPRDQRVYLRGWCYDTDPVYVAEHRDLYRSPAMAAASAEALSIADAGIDDIAHLDLYSCFGASLHFACDALGIVPTDPRGVTVTGGLPYHGGPGSGYMTHSIAQMVRVLRDHPGDLGLTSGVGMANTKHVFAVYSTEPGAPRPPDAAAIQRRLDADGCAAIIEDYTGPATVATYSVVHGRDGAPEWGLVVCDLPGDSGRIYAKLLDADALVAAERSELIGAAVSIAGHAFAGPAGEQLGHLARLR